VTLLPSAACGGDDDAGADVGSTSTVGGTETTLQSLDATLDVRSSQSPDARRNADIGLSPG
jgi:hypothetical protein